MNQPQPVLVIGRARLPRAFLTVIRSLGRAGLPVHALVPEGDAGSALASRYVAKVHRLPGDLESADWVEAVRSLVVDQEIPAVMPVDDTNLIPLHEHRSRLGDAADRFALLGERAYRVSQDKPQQRRLAEALGIPVAAGIVAGDPTTASEFARGSLPVVIKPASSFTPDNLGSKRQVRIARTPIEVDAALVESGTPVVVERFFNGVGVGVGFLARKGEVVMAFQHRRIHERIGGGDSSYRVGVPLDPGLGAAVEKLASATEYHGVGMAEFRVDRDTGAWVFVELNGRFWGSLPLAVASGADFPFHLYRMTWHGATDFPTVYRSGLFGRNEPRDLQWFWHNLRSDRNDPLLGTIPLLRVLAEAGNLITGRERWDTLVSDDPAPAWREVTGFAGRLWRRTLRRGYRSIAAVTRRAARRRELRALTSQRRHLLVVCHGNICRSPYAARRLAAVLPTGWQVRQAGTHPVPGRPSTPEAIAAAAERGIDLSGHASHSVTAADVKEAGAVLAFDWRIRDELVERFPQYASRVFLLGQVTPGSVEVADPYGRPLASYRETYRDIDRRIANLVELLSGS